VSEALSSAIYRALSKIVFVECHSRQIMALDTNLLWRDPNTRHTLTLGKCVFTECQSPDEMRHTTKSRQQTFIADDRYLCRVFGVDTRQNNFFIECPPVSTRQIKALPSVFIWHSAKYIFVFFTFCTKNFLLCSYTIYAYMFNFGTIYKSVCYNC
jgi:hypothetical protein